MSYSQNTRGSIWHRWDPHLHAPGTLLADQFGGDWETYLSAIENSQPTVRALGVTDYFCIKAYEKVCDWKEKERLPNVEFIFPNVEMRLDVKTGRGKGVNIHLLFSPDDPEHRTEIERVLSHLTFEFREREYRCTTEDFKKLGYVFDEEQKDVRAAIRTGANQFKTTLHDLRKLFRIDSWLRQNCLVAVAGGKGDGTSGLQDEAFAALRQELEAFAHIIFSATPSQRDFWLGRRPKADRSFIERVYGNLKPCLHGSDAHRGDSVALPDMDRYCWIKGDLCFESLRQAVIEPEERVWQGTSPPEGGNIPGSITLLETSKTPWLRNEEIELNPGLVAIIGARGSGKTALVDMLASGAKAMASELTESSFLKRASSPIDHIGNAVATLTWGDGTLSETPLRPESEEDSVRDGAPEASYLSQQFVEQLCSSAGLATELREEMERVVFAALDPIKRQETGSFEELVKVLIGPARRRRSELQDLIDVTAEKIAEEEHLHERLPRLKKQQKEMAANLRSARKEVASLLRKGKKERAQRLGLLEEACATAQKRLEKLHRRLQVLRDLKVDVAHVRSVIEPRRLNEMRERFARADLSESQWTAFAMDFQGDVDRMIEHEMDSTKKVIQQLTEGDPESPVDTNNVPLDRWPLLPLQDTRDALKNEVGIDSRQQRRYSQLQRSIGEQEGSLRQLTADVERAKGAQNRRKQLIDSRRSTYAQVFNTFTEEETILRNLYSPLRAQLRSGRGAISRLEFSVRRVIDLDRWVSDGEALLDLRYSTRFRGRGSLKSHVEADLLPAWTSGTATEVEIAMDRFRSESQDDFQKARPQSIQREERRAWANSVASWLYTTGHVSIEYGIQYDGIEIEQLSPGTRGIVLLLLYLAIDQADRRPLIIDQPEENLDPKTVFQELVPHFRDARTRRQVIVVTHNANLVVNTDADQVIIARSRLDPDQALPLITYESGSIENPRIRASICRILEGGERAFLERERRYRLRWDIDKDTKSRLTKSLLE